MTPEQQRIRIAEACGWKPRHHPAFDPLCPWGCPPWNAEEWLPVPKFESDLNAMHEAEKTLLNSQRQFFMGHLQQIIRQGQKYDYTNFRKVSATAAQRAEAFLKTIGQWNHL